MFGTIILFVLLTPGILLPRTFYGLPRVAAAAVYGLLLAYLLQNYYSIPVLSMIEPFQAKKLPNNRLCGNHAQCESGNCAAKGGKAGSAGPKFCQPKPDPVGIKKIATIMPKRA